MCSFFVNIHDLAIVTEKVFIIPIIKQEYWNVYRYCNCIIYRGRDNKKGGSNSLGNLLSFFIPYFIALDFVVYKWWLIEHINGKDQRSLNP